MAGISPTLTLTVGLARGTSSSHTYFIFRNEEIHSGIAQNFSAILQAGGDLSYIQAGGGMFSQGMYYLGQVFSLFMRYRALVFLYLRD